MDDETRQIIVVGAGAAGLSAALVLGRARMDTLVLDAGEQSNLPDHGVGGLLGHEGTPPFELYAAGRAELDDFPTVELRSGRVVSGRRDEPGFVLDLEGGEELRARQVLLATGMDYRYPDLPGVAERWGDSVFHCPFCHGWEVRDRDLGVLADAPHAAHPALMLRMWSDSVTVFGAAPAGIAGKDRERLKAAGVRVEDRSIAEVRGEAEAQTVVLDDGEEVPCGGLMVPAPLHQRSELATQLGATLVERGPNAPAAVELDAGFLTGVPGLFAAGDVSTGMPSVAGAIAAGHAAAARAVGEVAMAVGQPA